MVNSRAGGYEKAIRSSLCLHRRGPAVQAELRALPVHVRRQIATYVRVLRRQTDRDKVTITCDVLGLLNCPAIRGHVLEDWHTNGIARWAAVTSFFVRTIRNEAPVLLGRYVRDLLPCVAKVIAPAVGVFRFGKANEFRQAVRDRNRQDLRMSLLGPLSMFFLESVARACLAWDVLVGPEDRPERAHLFGWAPTVDHLLAAVRLALLSQIGRQLRPKALIYSPLARYLKAMGMVHPVAVKRQASDTATSRWLLSNEFLGSACRFGPGWAIPDDAPTRTDSFPDLDSVMDFRTGRRVPPPEELQLAEAKRRLLAAVRALLGRYAGASRPQMKRLALWAHVADVNPVGLVHRPGDIGERALESLAAAAICRRSSHSGVGRLNAKLRNPDFIGGRSAETPLTDAQCRTYLCRIRRDFREELKARCNDPEGIALWFS